MNGQDVSTVVSSRSKQYEINTSAMFTTANQFKVTTDFSHEDQRFQTLFQQFSLDIGRFDVKFRWINTIRLFTFPFFLLLAACGLIIIDLSTLDSIVRYVFEALRYIQIYLPSSVSFHIRLLFNLLLLVIYFSLIMFLVYIISRYKNHSCISLAETYFFVILSRVIMPVLSSYISHLFASSLYELIFTNNNQNAAVLLVISLPLIITQIVYIFLSCGAYNATPIIRKNDATQTWFSFSKLDWQINIILFIMIFIQTIFKFLSREVASIIFTIAEILIGLTFAIIIFLELPYIYPKTNSIMFSAAIVTPFCALCPTLAYYTPSSMAYYLIILIVLIITSIFVGRLIINVRMIRILRSFDIINDQRPTNDDKNDFLAMLNQPNEEQIDFNVLNIKDEKRLSLLTRVGFLYNVQDVNNFSFIKWGLDITGKPDFILSAIQVAFAIKEEIVILTSLYQASLKIVKGPFNMRAFISLYNILRQELLTQLNQPLLEAISLAKRSNRTLQHSIADFWGAVLKQKTETLLLLLPEISNETRKTELLYMRLARNYPTSPTVFKEVTTFYHKSVGDHQMTVHYQNQIEKNKNHHNPLDRSFSSSSASNSTSTQDNVDHEFQERMEPYLAAQDLIMALPSPPLYWMYTIMVLVFVAMLAMPSIILGVSLHDVERFNEAFSPVHLIGSLETAITRIPQLMRRRNLYEVDTILPHMDETGPPMFTHREFISKESIITAINKYYQILDLGSKEFLKLCNPDSAFADACSDKSHLTYVGDSIVYATVFDMLSSYLTSLHDVIMENSTFDWSTASTSSNLIYIMKNFDTFYLAMHEITNVLTLKINNYRDYFSQLSMIWLILLWSFPFVAILPLTLTTGYIFKREVTFTLKMFFQIPKNEISSLRWALKAKKQGKTYSVSQGNNQHNKSKSSSVSNIDSVELTEVQKNDELIDSLANVPRKITGLTGGFILHLFILVLLTGTMCTIGIVVFRESTFQLIDMANSYVYSINVYSSTLASYVWTQEFFAQQPILFDKPTLKNKSTGYVKLLIDLFDDFLYGDNASDSTAALLLGNDVVKQFISSKKTVYSDDQVDYEPSYGLVHAVYITMSCESQMRIFSELSRWILANDSQVSLSFADKFVYHYEHLQFSHLNLYLSDATDMFNLKTNSLNDSKTDQLMLIFILMFLIQILYFCSFIVNSFRTLLRHLKCPRLLLLLVNPDALLKSQTMIKWLSGLLNASTQVHSAETSLNRCVDTDFVVQYSKCGLILANADLKIEKVNGTVCTLFKKSEDDIIGLNFINFLQDNIIDKFKNNLFNHLTTEIKKMKDGTSSTYKHQMTSTIFGTNSQLIYVSFIIEGFQDDEIDDISNPVKSFSILIMDRTTEHFQEALIESEKAKSEKLITSLIPPSIAKRLNDGESDISFEVQEATVLFTSVDKWNETISELSAVEVVSFLNVLFSAYDEELQNFPAITKLKTIGHIYMICGGLFTDSTVNSAQVVLDFSLKMLQIVKKINEESKVKFQITVGMNTGGPINCGILGHTRPVFDIIGDSVNVASRMNSSGLPGFVQISDSSYNSVKFLNYFIKERGEIQIKGKGLKKTYLVADEPFSVPANRIKSSASKSSSNLNDMFKPLDL